jgi:hypothetical protein
MGGVCSTHGAQRDSYRIFVGKPEGKLVWDSMDWIDLA